MASSKLMASSASRGSDINRKVSACNSTTDFLGIDSGGGGGGGNASGKLASDSAMGEGFLKNANSNPDRELTAGITVLTPTSDGERDAPRAVRKTVDDVWREIVAGKKSDQKPKEEMMTLEDFLAKAGAAEEEEEEEAGTTTRGVVDVKEEDFGGGFSAYRSNSVVASRSGVSLDIGGFGGGRGKRSLSLLEPLDKAALQRQRRMIKNRESAARSRERKQAYQVELETMAVRLEEENDQLLKEKAERRKKRLKQLMDNLIPVVEKRRPQRLRLRRVRSMQW